MNSTNIKISNFLESQIPNFIVEEFPKFKEFFQGYYNSLEISGGILDISNNLLEYFDLDNLTKNNLVKKFILASSVGQSDDIIFLVDVNGLPEKEGIIQIDNEIIFYTSVDNVNKSLVGCKRGYSATTELKEFGTTVKTSQAAAHNINATVLNLSNLVLFSIVKNYQNQYLQGFPYTELNSDVDQTTIIKNIRHFYERKGTDLSVEFLFRSIFDEEATVRKPSEFLLKASTSDWSVDDIIKVIAISGNPFDIVGNEIFQTDKANTPEIRAIVDNVIVNNIASYNSGNQEVYEIRLNILNRNNFKVPSATLLRKSLSKTEKTIIVDSTIGFPEENGVIQINNELIFYKSKSFNQFLNCTRGYLSTTPEIHVNNSIVETTEYLYAYPGDSRDEKDIIKMKLLGVISSVDIKDGGVYYEEGQQVNISENGVVDTRKQFTSWILNENGLTSSSADPTINSKVSEILSNVSAVYKDKDYAYVASAGLAEAVGPFIGTPSNYSVGNQLHLKKIPLNPETATQIQKIGRVPVGMFVNGVEAYSNKDYEKVNFGKIESVTISDGGFGFDDNVPPNVRIIGGGGTGAQLSAKTINGKVVSVDIINGGQNYTSPPTIEISYGFGAEARVSSNLDLQDGRIKNITITSQGNDYILPPEVIITDISGTGFGAYAVARISNGKVVGIDVLNGGSDYRDSSTIIVNLVSSGRGCLATANLTEWNYDRVFLLKNNYNFSTNKWEESPQRKVDIGNGYLFFGLDNNLGLEYGYALNPKHLRYLLNDNVSSVSNEYKEITSGFVHSPILGWAYDGHPIYGPYGYNNPLSTSPIRRLTSSYRLKTTISSSRPSVNRYPLGAFVEDYEYVPGLGDLDSKNGRFCITPDFPQGTYAYFITVDQFGNGVYPYILGNAFNSVPNSSNFISTFKQNDRNLPDGVKRLRTQNTPSEGFDIDMQISQVSRGSVTSYGVGDSSPTHKVGDYVYLESKGTEGSGALATIETIKGVTVSSLTYSVASGTSLSGIPLSGNIPLYPSKITTNNPIKYEAILTTSEPHNLSNNDKIYVNIDAANLITTKTFKVRISSYQVIKYNPPSASTKLTANVSFNQTIIGVQSVNGFSINDFIYINRELCKITSIDRQAQQLTIVRNPVQRLHSAGDSVSLYIPDDQPDYRLNIGQTISDGSATGIISSIDKLNREIEIRVLSGNFTASSQLYDNSTPDQRPVFDGRKLILINSINAKKSYWEIDPTNTGNYYTRSLNFSLYRGTRYIFDVSDPSNTGYILSFSRDINNTVDIYNVIQDGVAGTPNSKTILSEINLLDLNLAKIYYYEKNNLLVNEKSSFDVKNIPYVGTYNVTRINDTTVKYSLVDQPEVSYINNFSYYTYSSSATGKINGIRNYEGGKGYKILPQVLGVTHIEQDNAKFFAEILGGKIISVQVLNPGSRYTDNTEIYVVSNTGNGAVLKPTIENGKIISVSVENSGKGYFQDDTKLIAIEKSNDIYPKSDNIGKIKSIRILNYGNQLNLDKTLSKTLNFNYNLVVTNLTGSLYKAQEVLNTSSGAVLETVSIYKIGNNSYVLKVKLLSGQLASHDTIIGTRESTTCVIKQVENSEIFGVVSGYIQKSGFYASDLGKVSSYSQKLTDSYYYQDFSYVIRSNKSLKDYQNIVKNSTHPLGFRLFGEVAVETSGIADVKPESFVQTQISIRADDIKVESTLRQVRRTVQIMNSKKVTQIPGVGAAINDFDNTEIDSKMIDDISPLFEDMDSYELRYQSSNIPEITQLETFLTINEVFQEPIDIKNITSVVYSGSTATITTSTAHNYAQTISGVTYPLNQIVTLSGITASGVNLNDNFYIFSVPTPNSFIVLLDNPDNFSGTAQLNNAIVKKGNFYIEDKKVYFTEKLFKFNTFSSNYYKFFDQQNTSRYVYKLKNLLFDGVQTKFDIRKIDNTMIVPEIDENLLIFIDGVLQYYGESYTIERNPFSSDYGKLIFSAPPQKEQNFFGYSFSKYKYFDEFVVDGTKFVFELQISGENFKVTNPDQVLVLLDGVPQRYGTSYIIKDSIISFSESIVKSKRCKILYFYGKTFEKKITLYNANIFSKFNLNQGELTNDGCPIYTPLPDSKQFIVPGDEIQIEGESAKQIIDTNKKFNKRGDNFEYVNIVFTDNSYVSGKNAVATAVMSGVTKNNVTSSGVGKIIIESPGLGYETAPIILFKTDCDNLGTGAKAVANVLNGKLISVDVVDPGYGYTKPPLILIAKRYNINRNSYPVYSDNNNTVFIDGKTLSTSSFLDVKIEEERIPMIIGIQASVNIVTNTFTTINTQTGVVDDSEYKLSYLNSSPTTPKLGTKLITFDTNKFNYATPDSGIGCGLTIEDVSRYLPNLTLGHFTERIYSEIGSFDDPVMNFALDSYLTYGSSLASDITDSDTTIQLSSTSSFPSQGSIFVGSELVTYESISGNSLINCTRGPNASSHSQGDYVRISWAI